MHPVSAVVVTHNSAGVIRECLAALRDLEQVVVVDNKSRDGTVNESCSIPYTRVIANEFNRGFAAAVNQGAAETSSRFLLILNPDVVLLDDLSPLIRAAEEHGGSAARLVNPDGTTQAGFTIRRLPTCWTLIFETLGLNAAWRRNPVNRRYRCLDRDLNVAGPAEQPAGALLMVRRDLFQRLGGFDEGYFPIWFEDVDFCRRAAEIGCKFWYEPGVCARHTGAHSVRSVDPGLRPAYWYGGLLRYAGKYFRRPQFRAVALAVFVRAVFSMLVAPILKTGASAAACGKVLRLALNCAFSAGVPSLRSEYLEIYEDPEGLQQFVPPSAVSRKE